VPKIVNETEDIHKIINCPARDKRHLKDQNEVTKDFREDGALLTSNQYLFLNSLFLGTLLGHGIDSCPEFVQVAEKLI
jgi:hypothetical protein